MAPKTEGGNAAYHNFLNDFAHIEDPIERRRLALEKIDDAPFGWYHIRAICVGGVGFMTDSYDIFAINLAMPMLGYVFWGGSVGGSGTPPAATSNLLKVSTSVGTVIGQLGFGWLADVVGRKKIYGSELIIIIATTIAQTMIGSSPAVNFVAVLTFWRIIMGIGIGGDYPLSSIITSEFATTKWRGAIMGAVFANQGWGQLLGGIVAIICVRSWKGSLIGAANATECTGDCIVAIDKMWRLLVGFGCVPGIIALYFRLTIPETPRYSFDVSNELEKAAADSEMFVSGQLGEASQQEIDEIKAATAVLRQKAEDFKDENEEPPAPPVASWSDFWGHFSQWKHGKILLGTAGSWFFLDVAYYGLSLNNAVILQTIGYASQSNVYTRLYNTCAGNLILICAGSIPGYWLAVATIDTLGRKTLQIAGFTILTGIFCVLGFAYHKLTSGGLLAFYVLAQLFQNWGPNTTTFIVPGECYPTRYRSTAHGISAASGKVGAIIAQSALGTLINHGCSADEPNCWLNHVMQIFALFMLLGLFTSFLIPETKRQTLEDIAERVHGEVNITKNHRTTGNSDSAKTEQEEV